VSNPRHHGPPPFLPLPAEYECFDLLTFPISEIPRHVEKGIDFWFRQLVGKSADEVRLMLQERWASMKPACLRAYAAALLQHEPLGILLYSEYPFRQPTHVARAVGLARRRKGDSPDKKRSVALRHVLPRSTPAVAAYTRLRR